MTDSSSSEGGQEQQQQAVEQNGPAQQEPPVPVNGEVGAGEPEPQQEEERTLTDHLNKKLLESFLARLDSGSMQLPPGARGADPPEEEDDFDD